MVNGKTILGTLSITFALILLFDTINELRFQSAQYPLLSVLFVLSLSILGVYLVRNGMIVKRKSS